MNQVRKNMLKIQKNNIFKVDSSNYFFNSSKFKNFETKKNSTYFGYTQSIFIFSCF